MRYTHPHQFEPLLPQKRLEELYALAQSVTETSLVLRGALHTATANTLARLLRAMNSYYSNKIEGHSTHPLNIARGLQKDFSTQPKVVHLQRLALAHIEAEEEIESWINSGTDFSPYSPEGIRRIHEALYSRLSIEDRTTEDGRLVEPGVWRNVDVEVGRHIPPQHESVLAFLSRYQNVYAGQASWDKQLVKIASAHQRLTWIHPFLDGNGRVARLATHAALYRDFTGGLWSVCRGLARTQKDYYARLEFADEPRRGDLDGRGNLTEEGLWRFCHYFLTVCNDQVTFMRDMLDFDGIRSRIRALVVFRSETDKQMRREAELPLHYLFTSGPLTRAEFKQMTGLGDKVAQTLLAHLLKTGLVETETPLGKVRFALPLDALQFYFPDMYPEAATRQDED
ncbi:MAG: Fic family protein [Burkholderiales bacterium]